ncbi:AraC family transcriptional regulator [Mesorhizobium sp. 1B3]|uniref:AraC family transcriptional regulator n=1 Tax=Mesorhizobium sp. 1B3 TaxID=3243599 RepID=UPI003D99FF4C
MIKGQFSILPCAITGVEAVVAGTRHHFPKHTHAQFGIGVIDNGAQRSLSGRGTVEAGPGDTITVNPGEVHDGAPIGDAGRSWRMLYIEPSLVSAAIVDMSEGRTNAFEFSRPAMTDARVARTFDDLFEAVTGAAGGAADLRCEELLLLLAGLMIERREQPIPDAVGRALSMIDDAPARPLSLSDLAQESGLSRFQVVRAFARVTGLTPHAYLMQRRIDLARRLIAESMPLAEAAAASGFADQSHMTRLFVRNFGVSPGAYAFAVAG